MKSHRWADGLTLMELLLAILILGIAVPVVLNLGAFVARSYGQTENWVRANSLARGLLEEILSQRFDELLAPTGGNWSALGPDSGEVRSPPCTPACYDDVDDYHGLTETVSGITGLTRSVQVTYMQSIGLQLTPTSATSHPYKRITVTVTGPTGVRVDLVGLATTINSEGQT